VLEKTIEIGAEAERQREERLVDAVITGASKGQGGIVNLDDTLSAAHEGRVQTLLVQEGFRAPGYRCQGCSYLTTQEVETCPFCGGDFEEIPDAVELVVQKIMRQGGDIEFVRDNEALEEYGNIGALLRY
jgi:peptide subunit release factor 1 (eRF1)